MPTNVRKPDKLPTGINGYDYISHGGLIKNRSTLISGTAGSGKTLFALQFLRNGIDQFQENSVLVTLEERPEDLLANVHSLGWNLHRRLDEGRLAIVDAALAVHEHAMVIGEFDLTALIVRIEHAVRKVGAKRLALDGSGLFSLFVDPRLVRRELKRLMMAVREMDVTAMITVERTDEERVARFDVEEFVADSIVILRNRLENEQRRRTVEILKCRGSMHEKGEFPFTIDPVEGVFITTVSSMEISQQASDERISLGVKELDRMCGGGVMSDSFILLSGATGTGKTLMAHQFMKAGIAAGQRSLLFAFEEDREQLIRNAAAWGIDFRGAEDNGQLRIICEYPERRGMEDHLINMRRAIADFKPERIAIDSISAIERIANGRSFIEFILGLISYAKAQRLATLFTYSSSALMGGPTITDTSASTISDLIIALRYVEIAGRVRRAVTVLKMRGSMHEKEIREYTVDGAGMHIKGPFRDVSDGILTGAAMYLGRRVGRATSSKRSPDAE